MDAILQIIVLGGLFFLMMKFGCGSHMSGHGSHGKAHGKDEGPGKQHSHQPGAEQSLALVADSKDRDPVPEKDVDPVCHRTVSTNRSKTSLYNGLVYFFCSNECREEFESNPEKFAASGIDSEN